MTYCQCLCLHSEFANHTCAIRQSAFQGAVGSKTRNPKNQSIIPSRCRPAPPRFQFIRKPCFPHRNHRQDTNPSFPSAMVLGDSKPSFNPCRIEPADSCGEIPVLRCHQPCHARYFTIDLRMTDHFERGQAPEEEFKLTGQPADSR